MKTNLFKPAGLAVLTNQLPHGIAVCGFEIGQIQPDTADSRVQLLPDGQFKAKDGRPFETSTGYWLMDELAFRLIQEDAARRTNDFHFDYEHQTLNSEFNGQPAPAAGWWRELDYVPGEGLFAVNPRWVERAKGYIKNEEYRYISAVFHYDLETGRVLQLLHAALTNDPALDGLKAVEALKKNTLTQYDNQGERPMNEALRLLLGLLNVEIGQDVDLTDAAVCKQYQDKAQTAITALKADAGKVTELNQQIVALKSGSGNPDPAKYVPVAVVTDMQTQLAALKSQIDGGEVDQLIAQGKKDGRLLPSMEAWAKELGSKDIAALKSYLDSAAPIAALKGKQTNSSTPPVDDKTGLTQEQLAVCKTTGLSAEEFKATLDDN